MNINTKFTFEEIQNAFNQQYIFTSQKMIKDSGYAINLDLEFPIKNSLIKKDSGVRNFLLQFIAFYIWKNIYTQYRIPEKIDETLILLSDKINTDKIITRGIFQKCIMDNEQVINEFITWLKDTFTFNSNKVSIAGMTLGYSEVFPLKIENKCANGIFIFKTQANPENIKYNIEQRFNSDMETIIQLCSLQDKTFCGINIFIDNWGSPFQLLKYTPAYYKIIKGKS